MFKHGWGRKRGSCCKLNNKKTCCKPNNKPLLLWERETSPSRAALSHPVASPHYLQRLREM